jgi:hypothetical protein
LDGDDVIEVIVSSEQIICPVQLNVVINTNKEERSIDLNFIFYFFSYSFRFSDYSLFFKVVILSPLFFGPQKYAVMRSQFRLSVALSFVR